MATGVSIPPHLKERFPDEMTIVLQEWFADLAVTQDRFSVTLNFSDMPQTLVVPFEAVRTFVDPSVEFGLRFETQADEEESTTAPAIVPEVEEAPMEPMAEAEAEPEDDRPKEAEVVSLDQFRK